MSGIRIHDSRNLSIDYQPDRARYEVTVRFGDDAIRGHAPAQCPRCGSKSHISLWELEGPGGETNTMWLICAGEPACLLDDEPLRWSTQVDFQADWDDL